MNEPRLPGTRSTSYGQDRTSLVDRFGVYLSKRAICRHLPPGHNLRALDIGCGFNAVLLQALLPRIGEAVAIDVRIADEVKKTPKLSVIEGAIEKVLPSLDSNAFDLVLFTSVLEHLWEPMAALAHCNRVLNPAGSLFLNVPTWRGKLFLEFSAFSLHTSPAFEMDDHKMYYDKKDLWPLLVRAGFRPSNIRLSYHKFGLNLFGIAQKTPDDKPA